MTSRRSFLIQCCQGVVTALAVSWSRGFAFAAQRGFNAPPAGGSDTEFHLHPNYRTQRPLDALLLKTNADLDNFVTEKYADQVAAVLAQWSAGVRRVPQDLTAMESSLGLDFSGSSLHAADSRVMRTDSVLEVRRNKFDGPALERGRFLDQLRASLSSFAAIETAEFQVTDIEVNSAEASGNLGLTTRVRYEFVGSGKGSHREQRVGEWELQWEADSSQENFRVRRWRAFEETQSRAAEPVFVDIASQVLGANASYAGQLLHGADYWRSTLDAACGIDVYGHNGVAVGDIDGDGCDDLYVCQPAGLPNRLYRNRGDGTFEDVTQASGTGVLENTACALFADINNDGQQELIVVRTSGPLLFLNDGSGKFRPQPDAFQFANAPQGTFTGAALADYDRDGWLDIYFCLYIYYQGTDQYNYPVPYYAAENGPPNFLLRNNRDGTFRDVTAETGLNQNNTRYSFCCGWDDYNHDGWPDLYVVNDFGKKNLYRNNGDGTFTDVAEQAGVEDVGAGMSVCWFDYDGDGTSDLYVADMWTAAGERIAAQPSFQKDASQEVRALYRRHAMGNSLFRGNDRGTFEDTVNRAGVAVGRWAWSSDAWDYDHDGFADLYVANGMLSGPSREDLNSFFWRQVVANSPNDARPTHNYEQGWNALNELIRADATWSGYERNVFYANNRDGTFSDVSGAVGLDFVEDGRSFAFADFDHDGRVEVFLKNRNGPQLRVLKNTMDNLPPSIAFRLRGTKSNRDAIGAVVTIEASLGRQTRTLQAGSGFLSQHTKEISFGLGEAPGAVSATIRWPSGTVQELHELPGNSRIWVEEASKPARIEPFSARAPYSAKAAARAYADTTPDRIETWLLAPIAAPEFSLTDLAGRTRKLLDFRGKIVLLNLFAVQSSACKENLKFLNRVQSRSDTRSLQLIALALNSAPDAELQALVRELRLSFPVLHGSDDMAAIYDILYRYLFDRHRDLTLPTSFLIDEKGVIVKVYQGIINDEHVEQDLQQIPRTTDERMASALPFPGLIEVTEFRRNYLSLGSVYFQRGYLEQAQASFQSALADDPSSAEALYGLGSVYLQQQKNAEAQANFERVVKLQARYPEVLPNTWNNLGLLETRKGHTLEAIPYFQQALQLSPDHLVALENLGNAYRREKRWDEARQTLQRAVEVGPEDPEANYSLGMVFAQTNDNDQAYEYLQRALQFRPDYPEALNNLGVLYLRTERREQAVASFEKCIRVAPAFDQSYLNLARVYALEGSSEKAREVLLELLKRHPGLPQAEQALAELPH